MRILLTNTGPWGTGSFSSIESIANELKKLDHQVKVFFPDNGFETTNKSKYYNRPDTYEIWQFPIEKNGIKIPYFPLMLPGLHPRANDKEYTLKNFSSYEFVTYFELLEHKLTELLKSYQPDIIECQHIWAFGYVLAKLKHNYILCAHNSDQIAFTYDKRMQEKATFAAQNAKLIFAVSNHTKDLATNLYNVDPEKIVVLPNTYDEKTFKKMIINRKEFLKSLGLNIPQDAKIACFAGLKTRTKGIDLLLKANRLLDPKDKIHFFLFGSGNIYDTLEPNEINEICLDRVHVLGYRPIETLVKAYNIANLFVLPSRKEGFPVSILEAMATGLPVVAASGYGAEKILVGETFKNNDPISLASAITKIAKLHNSDYQLLKKQAIKKTNDYSIKKLIVTRLYYYNLFAGIK